MKNPSMLLLNGRCAPAYHSIIRGVVCETYFWDTERSPVDPSQKPQWRFTDCLARGELCSKPKPDPFGSRPIQFRNAQYS